MGKHCRCAIGICDNDMHKKDSNVDEDYIMYKLLKDGAA